MERKAFLALRKEVWVQLFPDVKELEVLLVPGNMPDLSTSKIIGQTPKGLASDLCTDAFLDWRGYVENGKKVPNTLENRIEFYGFPPCRTAIGNHLERLNVEAVTGESSAASD